MRIFAAWITLALLTTSCSRSTEAHSAPEPASDMVVAVARATPDTITRDVLISGEFHAYQAVDVHAKVAGYLRRINVDVGDRVRAGQLLAVLEMPEMRDDLAQASAASQRSNAEVARAQQELASAEAGLRISQLSYNRLATVNKKEPGLIAQQELDEALARQQGAEAKEAAAKATLNAMRESVTVAQAGERRARTMTDYSQITAPFSGVITKRYADTGAMIPAGTASQAQTLPLVRVAQIDRLRLVLPVPESLVPSMRTGKPVEVQVRSLNRSYHGTVARLSRDVQLATRTMDVEVDVPNTDGELVPGMVAETTLRLDHHENTLTIPPQSITARDGKKYVLLVNGSKVLEERAVQVGLETASKVEILHGLAGGDLIVIGNRGQLRSGQHVEPKVVKVG